MPNLGFCFQREQKVNQLTGTWCVDFETRFSPVRRSFRDLWRDQHARWMPGIFGVESAFRARGFAFG